MERTIQLYCADISYFLRPTQKPVSDLTLEDAETFLTVKRLEDKSPETHNHYRSAIKYSSGLRVSEAIHLHYDEISRKNMAIHVRETNSIYFSESFSSKSPFLSP